VEVYLDGAEQSVASYRPPLRFELDTALLEDGPHSLRVVAHDARGRRSSRNLQFTVRNGPGIHIEGIADHDIVEGTVPVLVNAYGGQDVAEWQPDQAETPSAIPTWTWVVFILIAAFGLFYGIQQWRPPASFATTPTYGTWNLSTTVHRDTTSHGTTTRQATTALQPTAPTQTQETGTATPSAQPLTSSGPATKRGTSQSSATPGAPAAAGTPRPNGKTLYDDTCSACHQASGQGVPGVFPPLAGDPVVTAKDPTQHILAVLHGLQGKKIGGVTYSAPMPAFGGSLSNAEVAAIINHERTSWGNQAPQVTATQVKTLRNP